MSRQPSPKMKKKRVATKQKEGKGRPKDMAKEAGQTYADVIKAAAKKKGKA